MKALPTVVRAEYCGEFEIRVVFTDGVQGTIDFSDWLTGAVTWPNDADIAPETLHERAKASAAA